MDSQFLPFLQISFKNEHCFYWSRAHSERDDPEGGGRIDHFRICCFGILVILSCSHLKNSRCREKLSLSFPYLPKGRSCRRNTLVINMNPLLGGFSSQGRWLLAGEETSQLDKLSQVETPPVSSSKGLFVLPNNHFLCPKRPTSSLPFPW